jgi:D-alanyl-D-alanine carboxypeptidase
MKRIFQFIMLLITGNSYAQPGADSLLKFISNNPGRSSIFLVENDIVKARLNENKQMPLASTVKVLVAVEFAKQAGKNVISQTTMIPLKELARYYIPNTDGGAHEEWIKYERSQKHIVNETVSLLDIARGMMIFSSNANTEYLMDVLGFDNVKNNIQLFNLKPHTAIYPLVASLFIYQNPKNKKEADILKAIRKLNEEEYSRFSYDIHNALKYDTLLLQKFRPQDLTMEMQKLWSDRLPSSTTKAYAQLAHVINKRKFFDEQTYAILADIMETLMENPANRQWLRHAGMKGGSTAWVLTKMLYATTKKDERIEMAYFFNNLTENENEKLQYWMNDFELAVLSNSEFRNKVSALFVKK